MLNAMVAILTVLLLASAWQRLRFRQIRRRLAQDRQRQFYPWDAFHVLVFFRLNRGDRLVETARAFNNQLVSTSKAHLVYAGQAAFTVASGQMDQRNWDGVLLLEYPSRIDFQNHYASADMQDARNYFSDTYLHGMRRDRRASSSIPLFLLRQRLRDILLGRWRVQPLQTSPEFETSPECQVWRDRASRLQAVAKINSQGLVVFSLIKFGQDGYLGAVETYGAPLLSRMAALNYGPLHIGRAVALEGFARFNRVYIIYFPSAEYYANLLSSQYFSSFAGNPHLGDTIRVPTIPITHRL